MKLSIIFTGVLATMAIASPATNKRVASRKSSSLLDAILDKIHLPAFEDLDELKQCLRTHKTYHTDFTKADDGMASISNVDHTCCIIAREMWYDGSTGWPPFIVDFTGTCDGATVHEASRSQMAILQGFFDSLQ